MGLITRVQLLGGTAPLKFGRAKTIDFEILFIDSP